jgi:isopentenyl phosphate kinase
MKDVLLIKLGGSVMTDKTVPRTFRAGVLERLVSELARAKRELPNTQFIIGHGHGSFGHVPAVKYRTKEGFVTKDSHKGMALVLDDVNYLNNVVTHLCVDADINAVSFRLAHVVTTKEGALRQSFLSVLDHYLKNELTPITCGDVLADEKKGCVIWSTEEVLSFLALHLKPNWPNITVVQATDVDGVLDENGLLVREITPKNWESIKPMVGKAKGIDMSGGMLLKVEESIALAQKGISTKIISGLHNDNLYNTLIGNDWIGTHIK